MQVRTNEFINIIEQHLSGTYVIQVSPISSSMPLASVFLIDGHATTTLLVGASLSKAKLVYPQNGCDGRPMVGGLNELRL